MLHDFISPQIAIHNLSIDVQLLSCRNVIEFKEIIQDLTSESVDRHEVPIIQVECHGDRYDGLIFEDDSYLPWPEVSDVLTPLNQACRFNLLAIFSACFGGHFLGEMGTIKPAPCWCMIAPTHVIDPGEVMQVIREFYLTLFQQADAGKAITKISKIRMNNGRWFGQPAELWFQRLILGYIERYCTHRAVRDRAKKMYRELRKDGIHRSIGFLKRGLKQRNRHSLLHNYFDNYFMINEIPENRERFRGAYRRLEQQLDDIRSRRKHVL